MTPPTWLDAQGRRRRTLACWTCGREVAPMRFLASDLHPHGWRPPQTLQIPDWCGCSTEYLPVPAANGWWHVLCGNCWDECRQARNRSKRQSSDVLIFWAVVGSFGSVSSASTDSLASNSSEQQLDSS
jgi:hypothetical protein